MFATLKLILPALLPSWRFFDEIAPSPRIEFAQLQSAQDIATDWQEFRARPQRLSGRSIVARLFWNPRWNESLFLVSCAERLMQHPTEHSRREILRRIAAELARGEARTVPYVQFRLVFIDRQAETLERHIVYVSSPHAWEEIL